VEDLREQLARLTPENFLVETPWRWLVHYPRYLLAMQVRLEKLASSGHRRDAQAMAQLTPYLARYGERCRLETDTGIDAELAAYRWMLEEYRVSLFAQQLGTSIKISSQRLEKQWAKLG
jgi:ATP-dependent helicase HrpA